MNALEMQDVGKVYSQGTRRVTALSQLTFTVPAGSVFGFVGPNGAGKSTAIKIAVGLVRQTRGKAFLFGHPCGSAAAQRLLGYCAETPVLPDFLTVRELLAWQAALAEIPSSRRASRIEDVLEQVHMGTSVGTRLRELSKGMQQRVALATSLLAQPPLLILDEPTSGLDPLAHRELLDLVREQRARGTAVFFSSHQLTEMEHLCDRIGVLSEGRLLASCSLADLATDGTFDIEYSGPPLPGAEALDGVYRISGASDQTVDLVRGAGGTIRSLAPRRQTLERWYFGELERARG